MKKKKGADPKKTKGFLFTKLRIFEIIITAFLSPIAVLVVASVAGLLNGILTMEDRFDSIDEQLKNINQAIQTETRNREDGDKEVFERIFDILDFNIIPSELFEETISKEYNGIDRPSGQDTNLIATSVVAYNKDTGEEYTVEQLSNLKLLVPYTSNKQEIVFYGSFNEAGQWDGECTLNVYEDNQLVLITDAEYDDGSLLSSKQVFSYELQSGDRVWALSDRTYEDGVGIGDTYLYEWTNAYEKDFALDDVIVGDVLYADEFITSLSPHLEAYYYGNTSDGLFNDDSGDAYMVYFFGDGTVRLLYSGRFKDGTFHDDTGEAWYIVKEENTDYMYYKGNFENGAEDHSVITELGHPPLTLEEIEAYIGDREYGVELRWAGFESVPSMVNMI